MAKIVGIGANVFDTLYTVPSFPKEDTKMRAVASKTAGGGPVATGLDGIAIYILSQIFVIMSKPRI